MKSSYVGEKVFLLIPRYAKCKLQYDSFGNSHQKNENIYCDSIESTGYCFISCQYGFQGYDLLEDYVCSHKDELLFTKKGYCIQLIKKDLKHLVLGETAFLGKNAKSEAEKVMHCVGK